MMKQNQEAMIWFFRACERSTKRKAPYFRLAELFDASGFTENQVESEMDKYPTLDKFTFFYNLGIFYYDRLKIDESLKWYLKAEKLRPTSSKLLNSMGMSYDEKEDYVKS
jgi:tetratricopeptide (TPR) repeat protein